MRIHLIAFANLVAAQSIHNATTETAAIRTFFYIGGEYTSDGAGGHIFHNQMYVEKLSPILYHKREERTPVVLIHGQAQTGTNFLNKPDGGKSWASHFLSAGHTVYIIDQTSRGRSAWQPGAGADVLSTYSAETIQQRFTAPSRYNLWPQARLHTQWPGTGVMLDPIFDAFYASNVQFNPNATYQQEMVQAAGAKLLDKLGEEVWVVGHSQGGLMAVLIADARANFTKGIILLEPTGPPFQDTVFSTRPVRDWGLTDIPLTYSPPVKDPLSDLIRQEVPAPDNTTIPCILQAEDPVPRELINLAPKPILTVTSEAGYHALYDYCTVQYLKQAGCAKTTHMELGKIGIHGNSHMMFMEKNSDDIWKAVHGWIEENE